MSSTAYGILGVGIDMVCVSELKKLDERTHGVFAKKTFSGAEQADAAARSDPYVFYAGRFAVKEAVFKAVAHLLPEKAFDFRMVETQTCEDGSPQIAVNSRLGDVLRRAHVERVLISISNEGDYAVAIAQAVSSPGWDACDQREDDAATKGHAWMMEQQNKGKSIQHVNPDGEEKQ